jgi:eukaryotic-like serine/threonine-protein kinase
VTAPRGGLPTSLVGWFPGDPEPPSDRVPLDGPRPFDTRLPAEIFAAPPPRPTEALSFSPVSEAALHPATGVATMVSPVRPAEPRATPEPALPAIGSVIEKYRIEALLGTGGFAAVYRATHLLLRIPVALKLLKPKVLKQRPLLADLLCEEARFAAQLNHPNVVRVFDVTHNPKITYIVMEYIEGESLHQAIHKRTRLRPSEALRLGIDVTQGLKAALDQGLIHRDIKPANILLARNGRAKIVDLGLAQHSDDLAKGKETSREVVGTPMYMAPEQALRPEDVDFRADIYSLGATLYHAVTGQPPFQDNDAVRVLHMHQSQPVRPPEEIVPGISFDLSRMLLWMLQKDRAARPDYDQLLAGLDEALKVSAIESKVGGLEGLVE